MLKKIFSVYLLMALTISCAGGFGKAKAPEPAAFTVVPNLPGYGHLLVKTVINAKSKNILKNTERGNRIPEL